MSKDPDPVYLLPIEFGPVEDTPVSQLTPYIFRRVQIPELGEEDDARLREDIQRKQRVLDPLWILPDGRIIDGRTRFRHAVALGFATVPTQTFKTSLTEIDVEVLAGHIALARRHLLSQQKNELIRQLIGLELEIQEAPLRRGPGRPRKGEEVTPRTQTRHSSVAHTRISGLTGMSERNVARVEAIGQRGSPRLKPHVGKSVSIGAADAALAPADPADATQIIEALKTIIPERLWDLSRGFKTWPRQDQDQFIELLGELSNDLKDALARRESRSGG